MPVLHKYKDNPAYYVLTNISGAVITYQLTEEGQRRLQQAGMADGQVFPRALLLDLLRSGDAYTHRTGVEVPGQPPDSGQLLLDFQDDPTPDGLFPCCEECQGLEGLHWVELVPKGDRAALLLCPSCRKKKLDQIDTSIPLPLLSRSQLLRLLEMTHVEKMLPSARRYRELLDQEFTSHWEALIRKKTVQQSALFEPEQLGGLPLSDKKRRTVD